MSSEETPVAEDVFDCYRWTRNLSLDETLLILLPGVGVAVGLVRGYGLPEWLIYALIIEWMLTACVQGLVHLYDPLGNLSEPARRLALRNSGRMACWGYIVAGMWTWLGFYPLVVAFGWVSGGWLVSRAIAVHVSWWWVRLSLVHLIWRVVVVLPFVLHPPAVT